MITVVRTTPIMQGKTGEAMEWAEKAEKTLNTKCSWKGQVLFNISGHLDKIYWVGTHDSLAAYETWREKMDTNDDYNGILQDATARGLFVGSGITDHFYKGFSK